MCDISTAPLNAIQEVSGDDVCAKQPYIATLHKHVTERHPNTAMLAQLYLGTSHVSYTAT